MTKPQPSTPNRKKKKAVGPERLYADLTESGGVVGLSIDRLNAGQVEYIRADLALSPAIVEAVDGIRIALNSPERGWLDRTRAAQRELERLLVATPSHAGRKAGGR